MKIAFFAGLTLAGFGTCAAAELCNYRPSALMGAGAAAAKEHSGAAIQTAGSAAKAAGFYTLTQVVTGGSVSAAGAASAGAAATGTTGLLGSVGSVAAVLTAPATLIGAAVVGGGGLLYEGYCYYAVDDRKTDPKEVLPILQNLGDNADPDFLRLVDLTFPADQLDPSITAKDLELQETHLLKIAKEWNTHGDPMAWTSYRASRLYVVNGQLRYKDFGRDTRIGDLGFVVARPKAETPDTVDGLLPAEPTLVQEAMPEMPATPQE
ncbi:hypothetical protein [Donghicola sp. XS_ASV15]|uniref:hypothetical protein n=1 Tax=Donghicola sp. XS_ASV15 TaxID=3241295 RepID=UPI0035128B44